MPEANSHPAPGHIARVSVASDEVAARPSAAPSDLNGPKGHWLKGNLGDLLTNPGPKIRQWHNQYGACFSVGLFRNRRVVMMAGTAANERVLQDQDDNFSSRWGWDILMELFGRNILTRDFEDHRIHRKLLTPLFKKPALQNYLFAMQPLIRKFTQQCDGPVDIYRLPKQLALDIALSVFAGIHDHSNNKEFNQQLTSVMDNVMAAKVRLPGTRYWRCLSARDRLRQLLVQEIAQRNDSTAPDMLSQLVNLRDTNGFYLSQQDIVDHMFGMLFAAHDTTASTMALLLYELAKQPQLQNDLRTECQTLYERTGSTELSWDGLQELPLSDAAIKETLRLYAPIQFLPRRAVRSFSFNGIDFPNNTHILLAPQATHFDAQCYPDPDKFNPQRFLSSTPDRYQFVPFGHGPHMCMGMHFAMMEIKAVLYNLLLNRLIKTTPDHTAISYLPIVRPERPMIVDFSALPLSTK